MPQKNNLIWWSIWMRCFDAEYPILMLGENEQDIHDTFDSTYKVRMAKGEVGYKILGKQTEVLELPDIITGEQVSHKRIIKCMECEEIG